MNRGPTEGMFAQLVSCLHTNPSGSEGEFSRKRSTGLVGLAEVEVKDESEERKEMSEMVERVERVV